MRTSTIDGTIQEATLKRTYRHVLQFSDIRFGLDDGTTRTVKSMVTTKAVGDALKPGARGRFYLFTALDVKGVHGVRLNDGTSTFGFPNNNEMIFLILGVVNFLWVTFMLVTNGGVPVLGVALLILAVVAYIFTSGTKREARRQFHGDVAPRAETIPAT